MTPQELRDQFTLSENKTCFACNGIALMPTHQYVSWLEQKVINLTASLQFQQDMNALVVGPDVCPKCGSEDVVTTIYCNKCQIAM